MAADRRRVGVDGVRNPQRAVPHFAGMLDHEKYGRIARTCDDFSRKALNERTGGTPTNVWETAEPEALRLEARGDLAAALQTYCDVILDGENQSAVFSSRARIHLALGETGHAKDYARRSICANPSRAAPRVVLVKALLSRREHAEALGEADLLLSSEPRDATHHYLRGKALFALSRLDEARKAFDVACSLEPTLLEVMLLRREVDRCIAMGRKQVGTQGPITFEIPAARAELRDVLISGRTNDAIKALSESRFADDPDAQLVLARRLVFDRQLERAVEIYDRVALKPDPYRHNAFVGKASVLLDLGRLKSAVALFVLLCAEKPNDIDASEGRARALEHVGRTDEAAGEYRRFVSLATSRSDVRVRAAQLWLDQHS